MGLTNSYKFTGIDKDLATREISDNIANKGFIQTSAQDVINWARTGSLHWMTFGFSLLCCRNDAYVNSKI
jgi:NADH-quinone oxidoreductase subunit B